LNVALYSNEYLYDLNIAPVGLILIKQMARHLHYVATYESYYFWNSLVDSKRTAMDKTLTVGGKYCTMEPLFVPHH
jgi:hypothetical protein